MIRVGLTGGIAAGKSEVARRLADLGAVVIDADLLAREVVAAGTDGLAEVVGVFGPTVLDADGELDRRRLGEMVFADAERRRRLEEIIHPRVRARAAELEAAAVAADPDAVVVQDIPLLTETGQADGFDLVVVVDAPTEVQVDRLVRLRGMTRADAERRVASQATRAERLAIADIVIENAGTASELDRQVTEVWQSVTLIGE